MGGSSSFVNPGLVVSLSSQAETNKWTISGPVKSNEIIVTRPGTVF